MKKLIIIPAYNEEEAIARTLESLEAIDADLLVIDDGSKDRTSDSVRETQATNPRLRLVSLPINSGIGAAMQTGFIYARDHHYDYALQFDGDGQHDADSIERLFARSIDEDIDLCIGSRFLEVESFSSSRLRRVGIRFFASLIGILSNARVTDPTSGFRLYSHRAISRFADYYPDDYPEPESLFWCSRNGLSVAEVAVTMHERQGGQSSIRYLATLYYMVKVSLAIIIDRIRSRELNEPGR